MIYSNLLFVLALLAPLLDVTAAAGKGNGRGGRSGNGNKAVSSAAVETATIAVASTVDTATIAVASTVDTATIVVASTAAASTVDTATAVDTATTAAASTVDTAAASASTDSAASSLNTAVAVASTLVASGTANSNVASLTLDSTVVQTGSQQDGSKDGTLDPGRSASQTDTENFINVCKGKTLTNGLQVAAGSCNGIPMGDVPAKTNMVSTIIIFPTFDSVVKADTTFTIKLQLAHLEAGSFTNPDTTYYSAPQAIGGQGDIIGHTHVTIQKLGASTNIVTPPDASKFAFFKGVNDKGDGKGGLSVTVNGGLPQGNYRLCTMASASNHQPVLMPVAQRGAQDDCTRWTVGGAGNAATVAGGASNTTAAAGTGNGKGEKKQGKRFIERALVV
ncbi:MAG: hypothetical protein M1829_006744 [Trizodia sp. TS-e1964]|nr:MAG: hypothetical protein M1829_006744 [Trizodia sp. TS-e1964]